MIRAIITALLLTTITATASFWESTDGPPSNAMCLVSNSKGHVFCGTPNSAIYRTTDLGTNWERLDKGIDDGGPNFVMVNEICVDKNDVLYAAVSSTGILRSTDNGNSWTKLDLGMEVEDNAILFVAIKNLDNGSTAVFVGHSGPRKVYFRYSDNNGDTFREIPLGNLPKAMNSIENVYLSPNSNRIFAMITYNLGLYRSDNMGTSWRRIDSDPLSGESDDLYTMITANKKGWLYLGRNALSSSARFKNACVLRSKNDGESWEYITEGWDSRDITNNKIRGIACGINDEVWAITNKGSGVFQSTNGGDLWINRNEGLPNDGAGAGIAVTPNNAVFIGQSGGFVYRYLGGVSVDEDLPSKVRIQSVSLTPNPVRDRVYVHATLNTPGNVTVQLFNVTGNPVVEPYRSHQAAQHHTISFATETLPNGVYMWTLTSADGVTTGSVVVNH